MRPFVTALLLAGAVLAACNDAPENEYAAACVKALRQDQGVWVFGSKTKAFAEAYCACFGDEIGKSKKMTDANKARTLTFLNRFDGSKSEGAAISAVSDFLKEIGDGKAELVAIVGRCQGRLTK